MEHATPFVAISTIEALCPRLWEPTDDSVPAVQPPFQLLLKQMPSYATPSIGVIATPGEAAAETYAAQFFTAGT